METLIKRETAEIKWGNECGCNYEVWAWMWECVRVRRTTAIVRACSLSK